MSFVGLWQWLGDNGDNIAGMAGIFTILGVVFQFYRASGAVLDGAAIARFVRFAFGAVAVGAVATVASVTGYYGLSQVWNPAFDTLQTARAAAESGDVVHALSLVNAALERQPDYDEARVERCKILARMNQLAQAAQDCAHVKPESALYAVAQIELANVRLTGGKARLALQTLDSVLRRDPNNVAARTGRCIAIVDLQFNPEPKLTVDDAASDEITPDVANDCAAAADENPTLITLTRACFAKLDLMNRAAKPEHLAACNRAYEMTGNGSIGEDAALSRLLATQCYGARLMDELAQARTECGAARERDRRNVYARKELCVTELNFKSFVAAEAACNEAIAINSNMKELYHNRCIARFWLGRLEEAAADCEKALMIESAYTLAQKSLCRVRFWQGDYERARAACEMAIADGLGPISTAEARAYLCRAQQRTGTPSDASQCSEALRKDPTSALAYAGRCEALQSGASALIVEAIVACNQAIGQYQICANYAPDVKFDRKLDACPAGVWLSKMRVEALVLRGNARRISGAFADAKQDAEAALQIDPEDKDARRLKEALEASS